MSKKIANADAETNAKSEFESDLLTESGAERIHLLESDVIDQIAAGEVVERPAHLIKELVENGLDAGATSVEVEYDQGGRRVRVTDNGKGILASDLSLALARHATSKILRADDLWSLNSFGFRGEALASIGSVSRLSLTSRPFNQNTAHKLISEFGRLGNVEPTGANPGTTVTVEELFENVPARLKFMKSDGAEAAQIKATLKALALAHEGIEFRLRTKGKTEALWTKTDSFLGRAKMVLGIERLFASTFEFEGFNVQVVYASPHDVAGNARNILIFVQGRWVQDRGLQAAVIDAFRGLLMHGEYPIAVIRVTAPNGEVDVNIHPTKSQIKFRDPQIAFRSVNRALREAIEKAPWLDNKNSEPSGVSNRAELGKKFSVAELTREYGGTVQNTPTQNLSVLNEASASVVSELSLATAPVHSLGRFEGPEFSAVQFRQKQDFTVRPANAGEDTEHHQTMGQTMGLSDLSGNNKSKLSTFQSHAGSEKVVTGAWSRLQIIGQADLTYIVTQDKNGLVLIDQHAAHERVAYEKLMQAWKNGDVDVQTLLLPLTIELEVEAVESIMSVAQNLENLGLSLDQVGPQAVAVRAKPTLISDQALKSVILNLGREMVERGGSFVLEKKIGDVCATLACHSVVRAGQSLSRDQMAGLLVQMDEFPLSSFCPHGRPVSVEYSFHKLERDFGRIV